MRRCYIGLGSNLDQPQEQLLQALRMLDQPSVAKLLRSSSFYASKPMGPQDQPDYVNAVAVVETLLAPLDFLHALQTIENHQGRVRERRWGARTLDLDILLYDDQVIELPELTVPHYGMAEREFVLYPLFEIAPDLVMPDGRKLGVLLDACPGNGLLTLLDSDSVHAQLAKS
ncbi:2-amino-4-hydroxy-6-hydroxymethyldihydropteridine diphosphokinase [Bowmanella pacifica]|uniref:2-amino-4-hydroxy-6-hydroxymethyldihydropteridine pyrophosphokinase n=1 Tax=Bowmanella pacifica TaxID=502051 RepID=A0A917Z025_9ALTE|nr:2-amino-4-hydroxy-6-hydroxymethyldihydropteridine diphosphokinase [Bowmanella pacifica]GGO71075.1 2-amino-4-hydroxy-6-hydroxymethyldihydropteridine pyrophosphokinase [Bowmanella pacifica]